MQQENERKNKKIAILIICAMMAIGLTAYALFLVKQPSSGPSGESGSVASEEVTTSEDSVAQEVTTSEESGAQEVMLPQDSEKKIETEVHFMLDSAAVLEENHQLKKELRNEFEIGKKAKTFGVVYFDGEDRLFEQEGWINRIRLQEEKPEKGFELTYKKRYRISGTDVDDAVRRAVADGFDLSDGEWEAEVEWGFSHMTLSVSHEANVDAGELKSVAELTPETGLSMVEQNMPAEERDWTTEQWGSRALESAQLVGPVFFTRYSGKYKDSKVQIEVWEIPEKDSGESRPITEISIKAEDCESASEIRGEISEKLQELGVLIEEDSLKTLQVMDAFLG